MFITYNEDGLVTAYSDNPRNLHDFKEGEQEAYVELEFSHIDCKEGGLTFKDGVLMNSGEAIAKVIENSKPIPAEGEEGFEASANQAV